MPWNDEDDRVGEPPDGRYSGDRADPDHWRHQRPREIVARVVLVTALVMLLG
jgi:hypothetical protein